MTYNFNGDWLNVADIKYIHTEKSEDPSYPFRLAVNFKSGGSISTVYRTKKSRDDEASRIAARMDACFEAQQPQSAQQIRMIVAAEVDKVRRDIRTLKKQIAEGGPGTC